MRSRGSFQQLLAVVVCSYPVLLCMCYPWTRNKGGNRDMHIVDLRSDEESAIRQVAALLVEGFATNWPGAWPDLESALEEVRESFPAGRISRVEQDSDGTVLGWVGGISH